MPKFSIIVPAYKAESTLKRCVESVISQSYNDWELILVDDGSTDTTPSICDEYASKDNRIIALHKENGGVSSARNFGIEKASGDWITFLDADDEIESSFLSYFVEGSANDDFQLSFYSDYISVYNGEKRVNYVGKGEIFPKNRINLFLKKYIDSPILKAVHSNFFLTKIIKEKSIRFNSKIRAGEDHVFVLDYLLYVDAAKVIRGNGYIYYLPYSYSLKYGSKLDELKYKSDLMEARVDAIALKHGIDLSDAKKTKWSHSLSNIDIIDLYDKAIFAQFLELYKTKCATDYRKDFKCNREARAASMLIQLSKSGIDVYKKQFENLKKLLFDNISERMYDSSAFPKTTRMLLYVASFRNSFLLKLFLYVFK